MTGDVFCAESEWCAGECFGGDAGGLREREEVGFPDGAVVPEGAALEGAACDGVFVIEVSGGEALNDVYGDGTSDHDVVLCGRAAELPV